MQKKGIKYIGLKIIYLVFLLLLLKIRGYTQIIYGNNQYIEYHVGNLPIVISVPHGGKTTPANIPDRICNNAVTVTDAYTIELAQQIDSSFLAATGCHPHLIYCNLKRSKLDCNRNREDGACGNAEAETSWNEFHDFIDAAQETAQHQFDGKALYIDLHGHGHTIQRLELGYLLYGDELAKPDSILNTNQYIDYSSIQNLVSNNINSFSHTELLRGKYAFGTLMGNAGYPSVPSVQIPFPQAGEDYFSGGYNCANHTSYAINNSVNGFQLECNYTNVRDSDAHRKLFADSLVSVIIHYLAVHQNLNLADCSILASKYTFFDDRCLIYPNPSYDNISIQFGDSESENLSYTISNILGEVIIFNKLLDATETIDVSYLNPGIYILTVSSPDGYFSKQFVKL